MRIRNIWIQVGNTIFFMKEKVIINKQKKMINLNNKIMKIIGLKQNKKINKMNRKLLYHKQMILLQNKLKANLRINFKMLIKTEMKSVMNFLQCMLIFI